MFPTQQKEILILCEIVARHQRDLVANELIPPHAGFIELSFKERRSNMPRLIAGETF